MPPPKKQLKLAQNKLDVARDVLREVNVSHDKKMEDDHDLSASGDGEKEDEGNEKPSPVTPRRNPSRSNSREANYSSSSSKRSLSPSTLERKRKIAQQTGQRNAGKTTPVSSRSNQMKKYRNKLRKDELTLDELAQETLNDIEENEIIEDTLRQERKEQCEAFGNMMDEGDGGSDELTEALNKIKELDEKITKLSNDRKKYYEKLKYHQRKQKETNKVMEKRIKRQKFFPPKARKPFTKLQSASSRFEAVKKFVAFISTVFSCYLFIDFFAISRIAWPNIKTPFSLLTPPQTWQFMNEMNISFTKMRVIKRFFKECGYNIFSSEGSVYALIKNISNATVTITTNLLTKGKTVKCSRIQSLRDLIHQRVLAQLKGGRFPKNLKVLHLCFGFDKGGKTTKMVLMMGSLKSRNGPRNMSLLALFEGEESPEELRAAFQSIIDESKKIKRIQIGSRTIKVSFRFTGDLKCLKACLGLKAGCPNYPCIYCLQAKETTFKYYIEQSGDIRENYLFESNLPGQGHFGCLSWINPKQIVLPSLHIMMGVVEIIIDSLISRILIKKVSNNMEGFSLENLRKKHAKIAEKALTLKEKRSRFNDWTKIYEKIQLKMLLPPETQWPDGCCENSWIGEICCSSICVSKISNIILPPRYSSAEGNEVPDWLQNKQKMWYHTICLGLSSNQSITDAKKKNYDPPLKSKNEILEQIQIEIRLLSEEIKTIDEQLQKDMENLKLPKEFDDHPSLNALFKIFEKFGAYKTAFFQRYTGNHIRTILTAALPGEDGTSKLQKQILQNLELKELLNPESSQFDDKFKYGLDALHFLAKIQDNFKASVLVPFEIAELKDNLSKLEETMKKLPEIRVGHKFHLLLKHVGFVAERDKTIGFFSEHGIEAMHAIVNKLMQRLTVKSNECRLERVIQFVNSNAVTRDEYEQGKFEDVPAEIFDEEFENEESCESPFPDDLVEEEEVDADETIFILFNESSLD